MIAIELAVGIRPFSWPSAQFSVASASFSVQNRLLRPGTFRCIEQQADLAIAGNQL